MKMVIGCNYNLLDSKKLLVDYSGWEADDFVDGEPVVYDAAAGYRCDMVETNAYAYWGTN